MAGEVKAFNCPQCGSPVQVRAAGRSLAVVCGSCKTIIDPNDPNHKILSVAKSKETYLPAIPLGTRGTFEGTKYEVVGFMVRVDGLGEFMWREYLLHNPMQGYTWLLEYGGSWNFTKVLKSPPQDVSSSSVKYQNRTFFGRPIDRPKVVYVAGEFYWQVSVGETVNAKDYICAPYMISNEGNSEETVWTFSTLKSIREIREAFAPVYLNLPEKSDRAVNETDPEAGETGKVVMYSMMAIAVLLVFGIAGPPTSGSNAFTGMLAVVVGAFFARSDKSEDSYEE